MTLDLDAESAKVLLEVLDASLGELKEEIYHSDTANFKDGLKRRKEILIRLRDRVAVAA